MPEFIPSLLRNRTLLYNVSSHNEASAADALKKV